MYNLFANGERAAGHRLSGVDAQPTTTSSIRVKGPWTPQNITALQKPLSHALVLQYIPALLLCVAQNRRKPLKIIYGTKTGESINNIKIGGEEGLEIRINVQYPGTTLPTLPVVRRVWW